MELVRERSIGSLKIYIFVNFLKFCRKLDIVFFLCTVVKYTRIVRHQGRSLFVYKLGIDSV